MKRWSLESFASMSDADQYDAIWEVRRIVWNWYEKKGNPEDCDCYERFPGMLKQAMEILQTRYHVECDGMPQEWMQQLAGGMLQMVLNLAGPGGMMAEDIAGAHPYIPREIVNIPFKPYWKGKCKECEDCDYKKWRLMKYE